MNNQKHFLALAIAGVIASGSVFAENLQLEEVTVTAQKRTESAQDVPVAVSAFTADNLEAMGVQDFGDLAKASPSLTITATGGNSNENPVSLRGIGTYAFSVGIESSVALIVDDVPVPRSGAFFSSLSDVSSIEVLRGPQSTLFGKNASAGLISVRTNDPGQEFEGSVELLATSDDEKGAKVMLSGPISDAAGLRVTAYKKDRDGHIENLVTGNMVNGSEDQGFRAKFVVDATDNLSMTFIGEQNESEGNCCAPVFVGLSPDTAIIAGGSYEVLSNGITAGEDNRAVRQNQAQEDGTFSDSKDTSYSMKLNYTMGEYELTSVTAKREWDYNWSTSLIPHENFTLNQFGPYNSEQFTQELRLNSPADADFQYVIGAYYTDIDSKRAFERGPAFASKWSAATFSKSTSLFGQFDKALSEDLNLSVGLRYNNEKFGVEFDQLLRGESYAAETSDNALFGKLALEYTASDDAMIYGSYSQGYKAGGYDVTSAFNQDTADNPVDAETVDAFELGMKNTLMDGRVELNTALFYSTFDDFQAQSAREVDGVLVMVLNNVGKMSSKGIEVDVRALLSENWMLTGGFAYTKAEIDSWVGAQCWSGQSEAQGCIAGLQDLSGKEMSNSPDLKGSFALEYNQPLADTNLEVFSSFAYQWQSEMFYDLKGDPESTQSAYGLANLNIGVADLDDKYRVTFFVNNLFDQYYSAGYSNFRNFLGNGNEALMHYVPRGADRYMGLRVRYNF